MAKVQLRIVLSCIVVFLILALAHAADTPKAPKQPKPKKPKKPKKVKCKGSKKLYPFCKGIQFECPASCPRTCYVDCKRCSPVCPCDKPGGVCQDPRFIGGDGVMFYFHGKRDRDFCLVTDTDLHINAHFIGKPNPKRNSTRDFTWVQSVNILYGANQLHLSALKTATWDDSVDRLEIVYNGLSVALPNEENASWKSSDEPFTVVTRSSEANEAVVEVEGKFRITVDVVPITEEESEVHGYAINEEDCFAHLELGFKFYGLTEGVDGVLGQTYREGYVSGVKMSAPMPVMGGEDRFLVSGLGVADCKVARFRGEKGSVGVEKEEMKCGSGVFGSGIVCKK